MTLDEVRAKIDGIDKQLLPLFAARMDCAKQVAEIKRGSGQPIFNAGRERQILDRVSAQAGEYANEARVLYATMMDASRALQHRLLGGREEIRALVAKAGTHLGAGGHIACQGVDGAYSHQAALRLFPDGEPLFFRTFGEVFRAVSQGEADFGILPVENSSAGSVSEVYDLILKHRFFIAAAATVRVRHCLAAPPGTAEADVAEIYSHPQALAQCSEYLSQHGARAMPYSNTAAAAKMAAEQGGHIAVICSETAAETYGLSILRRDVQDNPNNRTRFVAISRGPVIPEDARKISLCFSLPHTIGSLYGVLARFSLSGLNLTKIESRPIVDKDFEYDFYLDFTGSVREPRTLDLISSLSAELPRFSFLGNYCEAPAF